MTTSDISAKNTKNEIFEAYQEVLQQLKESKKTNQLAVQPKPSEQVILNRAAQQTPDGIINDIAGLKLLIGKSLEGLENQLLHEQKKLTELQQAITLKTEELEEAYGIQKNADTLAALLQAHQQRKETFEKEMLKQQAILDQEITQKRSQWKKEQEAAESYQKELALTQKTMRQREEEAYVYKRDMERQKNHDQYTSEKQALEKELLEQRALLEKDYAEREAKIQIKEQEFESFKSEVEIFPVKLKQAVEETEQSVTNRLQFQYDHEIKLMQKEMESEQKLYHQRVTGLEAKIAQQEQHIKELTESAHHAGRQVQEIALKAIEGAARQPTYPSHYLDKSLESNKS